MVIYDDVSVFGKKLLYEKYKLSRGHSGQLTTVDKDNQLS